MQVTEETDAGFVALAPAVVVLPLVEERVVVRGGEHSHENPFCDLRAVDAGRSCQRDLSVLVYWAVCDVVCASGSEVDELELRTVLGRRGNGRECDEKRDILE